TDCWAPVVPSTIAKDLYVIGRLAAGRAAADAQDELTAFFRRPGGSRWGRDLRGVVHTLPRLILGDTRPALIVFAAAAGLLLLITCINVANLLLVRGLARVREIAVRSALGAGRGQVIVQLLTENALLALAGGALGLAVAADAVRSFVAFAPAGVPRLDEIQVNATVLGGAVAITSIAMLIFALAPAIITSRIELERALRSDPRHSAGRRSRRASEALVAGQLALALLVRGASPVVAVPFSGSGGWDGKPAAEGQSKEETDANPMLNMEVVTPDYFETLGIPVRRGRVFTDADREGAPPVVVLSESAARHYWGSDDPIGKRLRMGENFERTATVVGVVPDTRYRDLRDARASIYHPLRQSFFPYMPMNLAIRTSGPPAELVPMIRRVIAETEPGVALASAAPFRTFLEGPLAQPRLNALLLAVFAGAAVTLAGVGLFGAMATMVRQRTRELGVRMALGATARDLRRMVLRRGLTIAALGSVLGLLGALLGNRLLSALLYEVTPTDVTTFIAVTGLLIGVAVLASLIPAMSTTRIDPVVALRADG